MCSKLRIHGRQVWVAALAHENFTPVPDTKVLNEVDKVYQQILPIRRAVVLGLKTGFAHVLATKT